MKKIGEEEQNKKNRSDGIIVPEGVDLKKKGNEIYQILAKAPDISLSVENEDLIVVEDGMVERNVFRSENGNEEHIYLTVQENYVKGVVVLQGE